MMIRFLKAVLALLLYMALWTFPLVLWLQHEPDPDSSTILLAMLVIGISLIIIMDPITKWAFFWRGIGAPAPIDDVRAQILFMNRPELPVSVERHDDRFVITWKYLDAHWSEMFQKLGVTESYALHVVLDERHHRATLVDVKRSLVWGKGVDSAHIGWFAFRGVSFDVEIGKMWDIGTQYGPGRVYQYRFSTAEIRNPVINSLLRMGWDVRYGLF